MAASLKYALGTALFMFYCAGIQGGFGLSLWAIPLSIMSGLGGLLLIHKAIKVQFGPIDWNIMLDGLLEDRK